MVIADDETNSDDPPLYDQDDEVVILDADNFHDMIHNSSHCWFVKFYSNWCGHCKSFSPTYKQLAKDIKDWQPVIRLASYDCSIKSRSGKDNGRAVCFARPFYISGMPDMKFFPPNSDKENELPFTFDMIKKKVVKKLSLDGENICIII